MSTSGSLITRLRSLSSLFLKLYFLVLAGLLALNLSFRPHDPHFGLDANFGFWAVFGLGVGVVIIVVAGLIVQPLTLRNEDYYGDL
jgi:hypothetical protein